VTAVFFVNGAVFSSLFVRLPAIKADLGMTDGTLGLALLLAAAGLIVAQVAAGGLVARTGARRVMRGAAPAYCAALLPAGLAPTPLSFALALLAIGAANGALDVAMNVEAAAVERRARRPLMSFFHAAFSFGALAGAGCGGVAAAAGLEPAPHLALVAAIALASAVAATGRLPDSGVRGGNGDPLVARPSKRLAAFGALAFCVLLAEGSVADWSAVYLRESVGATQATAAAGLAAFSLTMGLGRLAGDGLAAAIGPRVLAAAGLAIAMAGLAAVVVAQRPGAAVAGFAVVGVGLATVFPLVVSAAADRGDVAPGLAIAAVSTTGYAGFLAGPPIIGLLAELLSLRLALLLPAALCAGALALVPALAARVDRPGRPAG
jgi:MFS family permease